MWTKHSHLQMGTLSPHKADINKESTERRK